ncbi:hypothetical protein V8C86DRAFT_1123056 [Haematococcus lacustris]
MLVLPASAALPFLLKAAVEQLKPRKCRSCWGAGSNVCPTCQGRGMVGGVLPGAPPLQRCTTCSRRGCVACQACGSTGLANSWLWQPAKDPGWGARGQ